jgi:hypothetical protein
VEGDPALKAAAWIGAALAVAVFLPQALRPCIRERADSWFHAAIVIAIDRDGLPPEDPYFAGFTLQYMWFFHTVLLGVKRMTAASPFMIMAFVNALAIWALCVAAADLGIALGLRNRAAVFSGLITPLGLCALFWVFLPVRALKALSGRTAGMDHLAEAFRLFPLGIATTRRFLSDFGSTPFFLNKFMVGTAYGLALTCLLFYLAAVIRFAAFRRGTHLSWGGFCIAAMLLLHPVAGIATVVVSGLAAGWLLWLGKDRGGFELVTCARWALAVVIPSALVAPYLRAITRGKPVEQFLPFYFDAWITSGIIVGCLFAAAAAIRPLLGLWRARRPESRLFVMWTVLTFGFAMFVRLPGPNASDKFSYLVYLPLAVAAGAWAAERWRGRAGVVWAFLTLAPVNLIGYAGYWGEPDPSDRLSDPLDAYTWLAASTPGDAVILENRERADVLIKVPRSLFFGREAYAEQWGYDPIKTAQRRQLQDTIFSTEGALEAEAMEPLRSLKRPVFVIFRREDFTLEAEFHKLDRYPEWFAPVFERPEIRIYRLNS